MEFPFDGHQTRHNRRNEEEREEYRRHADYPREEFYDGPPPPPRSVDPEFFPPQRPPSYDYGYPAPPPPSVDSEFFPPQRPPSYDYGYPAPPPPPYESSPYASVQHVAHDERPPPTESYPSSVRHESHQRFPIFHRKEDQKVDPEISQGQTMRIFCQAETEYSMTIRDGSVVLAPTNPSNPYQHWIKDEKYSTRVKDQDGYPSFALVNKATRQALQHAVSETQPVRLTRYNPNELDQSVLWTLSKDLGQGFRTIRMVNNIKLNLDAFHGDKDHGGVKDGTTLVLWTWAKGDNQRWKITPY